MKNISVLKRLSRLIFVVLSVISIIFMSDVKTKTNASSCVSEIVIDADSKRILYESNSDIKRAIASTTKIVTAITVINNFDVKQTLTIKKEWTNIEGSSIYLKEGEIFTVEELLYGLMLRSGNDCAVSLACGLSGSISDFCLLMNKQAKDYGAENSHFINPHGLHEENHYSTAKDLAVITAHALKNEFFAKIVRTKSKKIGIGESARLLNNKNKMLNNYPYATGVKTGYTKKAGRCLVSSANKNGFNLVCVVLDCAPMFERSEELLQQAYSDYKRVLLAEGGKTLTYIEVEKTSYYIPVGVKNDIYYPLTKSELNDVKFEFDLCRLSRIPVDGKKEMGTIKILLKNRLLFNEKIFTIL